jgi:hypothetical protein
MDEEWATGYLPLLQNGAQIVSNACPRNGGQSYSAERGLEISSMAKFVFWNERIFRRLPRSHVASQSAALFRHFIEQARNQVGV